MTSSNGPFDMGSFNTGGNPGDSPTYPFGGSTTPPDESQQPKRGGCLKWGGIIVAILAVIGLIGSCNSEPTEVEVPGPTTTVTTTESAKPTTRTVTTTATTTVTEEPTEEAVAEPASTTTDNDAVGVGAGAGAGAAADADNRQRSAAIAPAPAPAAPAPAPAAPASTYYANCSAVRAAGASPLYAGQPGYSTKLDRDGDGVACE